jgi:hypothetical protein
MKRAGRSAARWWLVTLVFGAASLAASPTTTATRPRCPNTGRTVVRSSDARIWSSQSREIDHYYGCAYRVGRAFPLDPPHGQLIEAKQKVVLAGSIAAYETMYFNVKPFRVVVRDLRTGSKIHSATSNAQGSTDGHTGPVAKIVLKRSGSVAWTASIQCICDSDVPIEPSGFEVHKIDRSNRPTLLDKGDAVNPLSLTLTTDHRRIEWRNGGTMRTAPLG